MEPYNVKPGLCVIINNMDFTLEPKLTHGKMDKESLEVLFITLGFEVESHENLTADQMIQKIESYSKKTHKGVFFLIILSHGTLAENREAVLGTDCEVVDIHYLESFFYANKCPSLHGVPKIFMIDACRGSNHEKTYTPKDTDGMVAQGSCAGKLHLASAISQPGTDSAHFAILYASTYGNAAFAIRGVGCQMTQTFVKVTTEASLDKTFIQITREVKARMQDSNAGQTVELVDRLNHAYLIKRFAFLKNFMVIILHVPT